MVSDLPVSPGRVLEAFPALAALAETDQAMLMAGARPVSLAAGTVLFRPGEPCRAFLMVVSGAIRVGLTSREGQAITLYRVARGQTCILTTACMMAGRAYDAEGVCETDVAALAVPPPLFDALMASSEGFRRFVFSSYGVRLTDLMRLVDAMAFVPLEHRLVRWLLSAAATASPIAMTHAQLAQDLGTAREVVSRHLRDLQRRGLIGQARGAITVLDRAGLETIVAGER
jgi:CRP/FNR family transcriptional regulator